MSSSVAYQYLESNRSLDDLLIIFAVVLVIAAALYMIYQHKRMHDMQRQVHCLREVARLMPPFSRDFAQSYNGVIV